MYDIDFSLFLIAMLCNKYLQYAVQFFNKKIVCLPNLNVLTYLCAVSFHLKFSPSEIKKLLLFLSRLCIFIKKIKNVFYIYHYPIRGN